jgi:integrase
MPRIALTDRFCAHAKPRNGGDRTDYFDEQTTGLSFRVADGRKSWSFHFTSPTDGKRARLSLGTYPATSLGAARGRALEAIGQVEAGRDPRAERSAGQATIVTVADEIERYLAHPEKTKLRTHAELKRRFEINVTPIIGDVRLSELHRRDVNRCLDPILMREAPTEAMRVFEDLRAMLRWAVRQGDLDHNPIEAMKKPATSAPRTRVLTADEIKTVWQGLPKSLARSRAAQRIVKLILLTAQRPGEVSGMELCELDFKSRTWTLPPRRVKNAQEHIVPLSDMAIEIISEAIAEAGEGADFVFPAEEEGLSSAALARTISRANEVDDERPLGRFNIAQWSAHDLRRTSLSLLAKLGVAPIVIGHVANHRSVTKANVTFLHYVHYAYDQEQRQAIDLLAERLAGIVDDKPLAEVVPIAAAR